MSISPTGAGPDMVHSMISTSPERPVSAERRESSGKLTRNGEEFVIGPLSIVKSKFYECSSSSTRSECSGYRSIESTWRRSCFERTFPRLSRITRYERPIDSYYSFGKRPQHPEGD